MCCQSNITFIIMAVLVVWCRPCRRYTLIWTAKIFNIILVTWKARQLYVFGQLNLLHRSLPNLYCWVPTFELPVKNLTSPFASATPISCNMGITLLLEYILAMFWGFLQCACAEIASILLPVYKLPSPSCWATTISYKRIKIVAIWQHYKQIFSIFSPRMRRNGYLWTSG